MCLQPRFKINHPQNTGKHGNTQCCIFAMSHSGLGPHGSTLTCVLDQLPYPGLQLGGELCLELAHGAIGVVSLDEHLGSHGRLLPQVLQAVCLWR